MIDARADFFLAEDHLLFFHQVRGLIQLEVETAKDVCEVYDAHLCRLTRLVKPASGDLAIAAFTAGLLTYHPLCEGRGAIRN